MDAQLRMLARRAGVSDPKLVSKTAEYVRLATSRLSGGSLGQVSTGRPLGLSWWQPCTFATRSTEPARPLRCCLPVAGGGMQGRRLHGAGQPDVSGQPLPPACAHVRPRSAGPDTPVLRHCLACTCRLGVPLEASVLRKSSGVSEQVRHSKRITA